MNCIVPKAVLAYILDITLTVLLKLRGPTFSMPTVHTQASSLGARKHPILDERS